MPSTRKKKKKKKKKRQGHIGRMLISARSAAYPTARKRERASPLMRLAGGCDLGEAGERVPAYDIAP